MYAVRMQAFGGPEVLEYTQVPDPELGPGQVRVALKAAGVNPAEAYIRTGTYAFFKPAFPYVPGFDGAGTVAEVSSDVTGFAVGDRVYVSSILSADRSGTYAEQVVCDGDGVHPLPDSLTYEQGAAVGVPCTTAYRALFQRARLQPGETVLIHGAAGGVGSAAVQLAAAAGAVVIGTASSPAGRELAARAGASHVLDHSDPEHMATLADITGGKGVNAIVEMLADKNLVTDLQALAMFGRVVVVGSRGALEFAPRLTMAKDTDVRGMALWNTPPSEWVAAAQGVADALASGGLKPIVGPTYPLAEAAAAQRDILEHRAAGKMVLQI